MKIEVTEFRGRGAIAAVTFGTAGFWPFWKPTEVTWEYYRRGDGMWFSPQDPDGFAGKTWCMRFDAAREIMLLKHPEPPPNAPLSRAYGCAR